MLPMLAPTSYFTQTENFSQFFILLKKCLVVLEKGNVEMLCSNDIIFILDIAKEKEVVNAVPKNPRKKILRLQKEHVI